MKRFSWDEFQPWDVIQSSQRQAAIEAARDASIIADYSVSWSKAGIGPEPISEDNWSAIPFLSKDILIQGASTMPPFGERLGVCRSELAHIFVAPGPLYMPFTGDDLDHVAGSFAKALGACGLEAGDLVDQTTMYNWVIAATVIDKALGMIGCSVIPGGIGQSERHLEVIRALGINAIVAFPTFLEHLLELASTTGVELPLRKAVVMGELNRPNAKQEIRSRHGIEVREFYGTADVGAVAWECQAGAGMHLRDDILVEFIDPETGEKAVPKFGAPAEIVVTDFGRRAMPIIRLRTGDLIDELTHGPCPCGRTSPRISRIVGRSSEITKVKGMFVVPRLVEDVLRRRGVDRRFCLVVDRQDGGRDRLTLRIAGEALGDADPIQREVEMALRLRVELAFVEHLDKNGPRLVDLRIDRLSALIP